MNENRTRIRESRGLAGRSARRALTLATLLSLAASGSAWAQTAPPATTPATPAAPATEAKPAPEAKPAEEAKGPNTGRLSISAGVDWTSAYFFRGINDGDQVQVIGTLGLAFAY